MTDEQARADTDALLARVMALPKTHRVTVNAKTGGSWQHDTHSQVSAENYASHMRFRFGPR